MSASLQNKKTNSSNNKLRLIPFTEQHFSILADWFFNEKEVVQWGGTTLYYPLNEAQFNAMLIETKTTPPNRLCWMLEDHAGELCGHCQLAFDWRNGTAIIGRVVISPKRQGSGLAAPMIRKVLEKAFSYADIERTELNVYTWNKKAIKIYTRVGFIAEGIRRSSARVGNERWDTKIMSILRDEWVKYSVESIDELQ
ncbi:GNAT family N-acetyltransferase [Brenneria tiliae]|uniref:GNAT family N-acetyltransferase n=1 Tax=Brenneria tiliae TaxID=2914984 RepID=A0ABT0MRS1_9GAMM|nr:GNAT family protein [Brenneria tiliae]MCL2892518.1 GNAT family N-acetyltransferase [Brenneria tiliae]